MLNQDEIQKIIDATDIVKLVSNYIKLEKNGKNVTIRREMGRDINGACGQLRKSYMEKTESEK